MFTDNFWAGFKEVLGEKHVVTDLSKCDFTDIYNHFMAERDKKKNMSKEVGARWFLFWWLISCQGLSAPDFSLGG
jgi:hypothetical protein